MVAEQRETVQRIDADTLDIASNVGGAQRELLKYYSNISSNRWLMLKVFGVLIVFVRSFPVAFYIQADCFARSF
jgi:syntaxin 5